MTDAFHEQDRERVLAELRVERLRLQLTIAHIDHLGLLLRDGMIQPAGARASLADIYGGHDAGQ